MLSHIYTGKGSRRECSNYRGITLLSCPGKLFAHILLNRIKDKLIATRRKEQSVSFPVDRIIAHPTTSSSTSSYRAGASIGGRALWLLLRSLGIPDKIVNLIRELYTDTVSCNRIEGDLSGWFELDSGVRLRLHFSTIHVPQPYELSP